MRPIADEPVAKASAAERRRALALLLDAWRDIARDLALAQAGSPRTVRDVALMEELDTAARDLPDGAAADALARLLRASELLDVERRAGARPGRAPRPLAPPPGRRMSDGDDGAARRAARPRPA